jgi:FixJ family two-component response regulator
MKPESFVHVVDDNQAVRESLQLFLKSTGLKVQTHESAERFLQVIDLAAPGCLIVDIRMPGMSGLELQSVLNDRGCQLPVIMITGHGDIPMAVRAMQAGAVDFLEKPYDNKVLLERIRHAFRLIAEKEQKKADLLQATQRIGKLTPREREVMDLLVKGRQNKDIAADLGISVRTAEVHRANIMKKLHAKSLSDVVRIALSGEAVT